MGFRDLCVRGGRDSEGSDPTDLLYLLHIDALSHVLRATTSTKTSILLQRVQPGGPCEGMATTSQGQKIYSKGRLRHLGEKTDSVRRTGDV